jgi:hypothetical protein
MIPLDRDARGDLIPDRRRAEVAKLLAAAILRLRSRSPRADEASGPEKAPESAPNWLEVPPEVRLTVPNG